jgi:hypothetical protein
MQEAEGANAVKAARGDVLKEAAEKLVGVETHELDRRLPARTTRAFSSPCAKRRRAGPSRPLRY